jgi:phosphatidylcholine synthase
MTRSGAALLVHLFTATGAVFAMLALLEATKGDWAGMYFWLVVAFAVDGVDGPLARHFDVKKNAPQYDGALMDLIIDYLTYVFIPAYALFASDLLPGWTGWIALLIITFASVVYFADTRMKTKDNSFAGFPGCWNMVVLVFFALEPGWWTILTVVVLLTIAMFTPLKFIHPVRTARWRALSLPVALIWTLLGGWAAWVGFFLPSWGHWALTLCSVYLVLVGIVQQALPERDADAARAD